MIGSKELIIDIEAILRGMSSGAEIADGGFSPETESVNPLASKGVLYGGCSLTDKSTGMSGNAIAWCETNVANINGYLLSDSGYIHSISSSQVLTAAASSLGGTWTTGTADIVQFIDKIYATSTTDVARMDTNLTNGDHDWWSSTQGEGTLTSGVRHPLVVFQDRLWVGDANALHKITDSGTSDKNLLVLLAHHEITALGVDPSSGKMLIATSHGQNYSGTISAGFSIFTYDGTSATYTREFIVDDLVTGFKNVGGVVYVAYGKKLGYWTGSGIAFLRDLRNVTLAGADLAYKHHMAVAGSTLYVLDGLQVLAYGEVLAGQKIFYYCQKNSVNSNKPAVLCPVGNGKLAFGFSSAKFYTWDIATGGSLTLYSNKYHFNRPVYLRKAYIEYADPVTDGDNNRNLYYMTNRGTGFVIMALQGGTNLQNSSGASVYEQDDIIGFPGKCNWLQLRYNGNDIGVKRIIVRYDPAE